MAKCWRLASHDSLSILGPKGEAMDEPIFEIPESLDALRAELRRLLLRCDYPVLRAALSVI